MNFKHIAFYILLLTTIISCTKEETCPEHEQTVYCTTSAYTGTWEWVGYDFSIEPDDCLSSMVIEKSNDQDDLILEEEDGFVKNGPTTYRLTNGAKCTAMEKNDGSIASNLILNTELYLRNPNFLEYTIRFFGSSTTSIYRRKQ